MTETRPLFSIIIVNFNGGAYLQASVDSLKVQTIQDFEVFIVDNASTDSSFRDLDVSGLATVHLLPQSTNLGFAVANNLAAKEARGTWLALLNPDAVAKPDWLAQINSGILRHSDALMFASAQINMDDPSLMDGAGDCYHIAGIPWRGGFLRPMSELPEEGYCFGPCGASAIYRADVFDTLGGFDEDFFCYVEDVDLAFAIRRIGGQCIFLPKAQITHKGSGISGRTSDFSLFHGSRNRVWTYVKNMPLWALVLTLPIHIGASMLLLLLGLKSHTAYQSLRGMWAGVVGIGPIWRKRGALKKSHPNAKSTALGAMAWNPFRLLKRHSHVMPLPPEK